MHCALKTHLPIRALHLIHRKAAQLSCVDVVGTKVRGDGVAHHVQLHRPLKDDAAEPIVVVVQCTLNGCQDSLREIRGVVLRAEIAHVEAQRFVDKLTAVFAVVSLQPSVHARNEPCIQPDNGSLDPFFCYFTHLYASPFSKGAIPCCACIFSGKVHPSLANTLQRCTLPNLQKSPALRGFVAERGPRTGTSLYLVLLSNG